ncbi:hypothetical protein [Thiomicrorhabdus lithotrophica]|uniref:PAS domain-containing protein n=1 Tax=Thiomicrorhabdus lithotrophica TaxID=2949997 RepID=A0ABY8C796_9GAMM|nr:hypothetical protein [Thiomicrorhabdus lithotrophica]WEJ61836.1 hypothetical protein NR989_07385 [Thiomicrorhabdus lithotrophica]
MNLKLNQNLELIEVSKNFLKKFDLLEEDLLGTNFLDMVPNTVPSNVIDELKEHCHNGLSNCYILHISLNQKVCWLNVNFQVLDTPSLGHTFEVRFFQLDKLSVRNAKEMYALMNFEPLSQVEQKDHREMASNDLDVYYEFN